MYQYRIEMVSELKFWYWRVPVFGRELSDDGACGRWPRKATGDLPQTGHRWLRRRGRHWTSRRSHLYSLLATLWRSQVRRLRYWAVLTKLIGRAAVWRKLDISGRNLLLDLITKRNPHSFSSVHYSTPGCLVRSGARTSTPPVEMFFEIGRTFFPSFPSPNIRPSWNTSRVNSSTCVALHSSKQPQTSLIFGSLFYFLGQLRYI